MLGLGVLVLALAYFAARQSGVFGGNNPPAVVDTTSGNGASTGARSGNVTNDRVGGPTGLPASNTAGGTGSTTGTVGQQSPGGGAGGVTTGGAGSASGSGVYGNGGTATGASAGSAVGVGGR